MNEQTHKDIVALMADKNMELSIKGLLSRHNAFGIRPVTYDLYIHPERDPGCLLRSHNFLRPFANRYIHALVILDREGCGQDKSSPRELENQIEKLLSRSGWDNRAAAIVLDPELEVWVWSDSPQVELILGWEGKSPNLKTWLSDQGFLATQRIKPNRPKEVLEQALKLAHKPRSSSLYFQLAQSVNFNRCADPAFVKLKTTLKNWFAEEL